MKQRREAGTIHGCIGNCKWLGFLEHRFQAQEMANGETEGSTAAGAGKEHAIYLEVIREPRQGMTL